jgi:hypothetical protein
MDALRENGTFNHLKAQFVHLFVTQGVPAGPDFLRPFSAHPNSLFYSLADEILVQYLSQPQLPLALESALSESGGAITANPKGAAKALALNTDSSLVGQLLESRDPSTRSGEFNSLKAGLRKRIDSLRPAVPRT